MCLWPQNAGEFPVAGKRVGKSGIVSSAQEAVSAISDRSILAVSGFKMATTPEYLILELPRKYERTGHSNGLLLIGTRSCGPGKGAG